MKSIERQLEGWCPEGGYQSYQLYELMIESNYAILPHAGGWLDQPAWYLRDVRKFMLMDEYARLNQQLPDAPGRGAPQSNASVPVSDNDG